MIVEVTATWPRDLCVRVHGRRPDPGRAGHDNTIVVYDGQPGERIWLAIGAAMGATELPGCPGVEVVIDRPQVRGPLVADSTGEARFEVHVAASRAGRTHGIQAVALDSCAVSNWELVHWPAAVERDLGLAEGILVGSRINDDAGSSVAAAGDVDGDGRLDVAVGSPGSDDGYFSLDGLVLLVTGPFGGEQSLDTATARLWGNTGDDVGYGLAGAGDVNGDGFADLLVGAHGDDVYATKAGTAYLVHGPVTGDIELSGSAVALWGEADYDFAGAQVDSAGDVDGDGFDDLLIGARGGRCRGRRLPGARACRRLAEPGRSRRPLLEQPSQPHGRLRRGRGWRSERGWAR